MLLMTFDVQIANKKFAKLGVVRSQTNRTNANLLKLIRMILGGPVAIRYLLNDLRHLAILYWAQMYFFGRAKF